MGAGGRVGVLSVGGGSGWKISFLSWRVRSLAVVNTFTAAASVVCGKASP